MGSVGIGGVGEKDPIVVLNVAATKLMVENAPSRRDAGTFPLSSEPPLEVWRMSSYLGCKSCKG